MRTGWVSPRLALVWLVLLALVATIAAIEHGGRTGSSGAGDAHGGGGVTMLFPAPLERIGALELGHAGVLHRFERDAAGAWFRHADHGKAEPGHPHRADPEQAERIGVVLAAFARTRVERRLPLEGAPDRYGLGAPAIVVLLYQERDAQPLAQYAIGGIAPDTYSRYALRIGSDEAVTIPNYQVENLLSLLK